MWLNRCNLNLYVVFRPIWLNKVFLSLPWQYYMITIMIFKKKLLHAKRFSNSIFFLIEHFVIVTILKYVKTWLWIFFSNFSCHYYYNHEDNVYCCGRNSCELWTLVLRIGYTQTNGRKKYSLIFDPCSYFIVKYIFLDPRSKFTKGDQTVQGHLV